MHGRSKIIFWKDKLGEAVLCKCGGHVIFKLWVSSTICNRCKNTSMFENDYFFLKTIEVYRICG
jgi:hypothetical protein